MEAVLPGGAAVLLALYQLIRNRQYWLGPILSVFLIWGYLCCGQAVENEKIAISLLEQQGEVKAIGVIVSLSPKANSTQGMLEDVTLQTKMDTVQLKKLIVYLSDATGITEGDQITVIGTLSGFDTATNPGQFDYRAYQAAHGIYLQLYGKDARIVKASVRPPERWLGTLRRSAMDIFLNASPTSGGTMAAMVLGDKTNLPEERYQLYLETGIGHILTLSGLHLSLLGVGLYGFLRKKVTIPTWPAAVGMTVALFLYVRLIGSGISAVRAMVAIVCSILAGCLGKTYDSLSAAGLGMLLILTEYPMQICRPAFWLSFGAVLAMGGILPELNRWLKPQKKLAKTMLSVLVIWIALMPVTAINQYVIQPYSLLLNLVVVPMMGPLLIGCIGVLGLGMAIPTAASWVARAIEAAFWAMDRLCELTINLPGSELIVGAPRYSQLMIYYGVLAGFLLLVVYRNRREWEAQENTVYEERSEKLSAKPNAFLRWSSVVVLCAALVLVLFLGVGRNRLQMIFLDVGQGDCICIRMPGGTTMVVDGGSTSEEQVGEYRILPCLTWAGIDRIDYLVITHLDEDHLNGLMELLQAGFPVGHLLMSKATTKWSKMELIGEIAEKNGTKVVLMGENDMIMSGKVEVKCVSPAKTLAPETENEASVVLELTYGQFSCLLTGDVEGDGEQAVETYVKNQSAYTVLKVAHHGSKYSTSEVFLTAVAPKAAVISCSKNNSYGHPHAELIARLEKTGCDIFCTADCGAVMVETDGVRWKIYGYVSGES
ncbi:MAG: DNA internalization-related competence protein ComEC/Rec2 [Lachnospiraceae bacterium]|nr:DNA internalization-related competence protein ComEC/Rec2 [Lachnospiraceae bacterium]